MAYVRAWEFTSWDDLKSDQLTKIKIEVSGPKKKAVNPDITLFKLGDLKKDDTGEFYVEVS